MGFAYAIKNFYDNKIQEIIHFSYYHRKSVVTYSFLGT